MGNVESSAMFHTFNMGIGLVVIVPKSKSDLSIKWFNNQGILAYEIGEVIEGNRELIGL